MKTIVLSLKCLSGDALQVLAVLCHCRMLVCLFVCFYMCCSCLLFVVQCSCVIHVFQLLTAHLVWHRLVCCSVLIMCCSWLLMFSGAPIRKLTDVPITDILGVVIPDIDTDTDN